MEIHEAAVKLKLTDQSLRLWLQSGHCPFGDAWKGKGKYFQYYIADERLAAYQEAKDLVAEQKKNA